MRHRNIGRYLSRSSSHRKALFLNLSKSLIKYGILKTTLEKAKELRRFIEPLITVSKIDSLTNRRFIFKKLRNKYIVHILFTEIAKRYLDRPGGYTRILKYKIRKGDNAKIAIIELINE